MSFYRDEGELVRVLPDAKVRQSGDMGEWIQAALTAQVSLYGDRDPDHARSPVRAARKVIAFHSLFGHHPAGEPARWADSHL